GPDLDAPAQVLAQPLEGMERRWAEEERDPVEAAEAHERRISRLAKPLVTAGTAAVDADPDPAVTEFPASPPADIRRDRAFVFPGSPLRALARRGASIVSLVFLDLFGLALGLYIALVLRWLYYEQS